MVAFIFQTLSDPLTLWTRRIHRVPLSRPTHARWGDPRFALAQRCHCFCRSRLRMRTSCRLMINVCAIPDTLQRCNLYKCIEIKAKNAVTGMAFIITIMQRTAALHGHKHAATGTPSLESPLTNGSRG
jgi:hypothetical protein